MGCDGRSTGVSKSEQLRDMVRELCWMGRYVSRYRVGVLIYIVMGIVNVALGLAGSVASKYLIDAVTGFKTASIGYAAALMGGTMLAGIGVRAIYSRLSARINAKVRNEIRAELFEAVLAADWESLQAFRSGDLLNRVNNDAGIVASATVSLLPNFVMALMQFLGALAVVLFYDPIMALIVLVSTPLSVLVSRVLMRRMRHFNKEMRRIDSDILSYNEDAFQNVQTVKAFDVGDHFVERLHRLQGNAYQTQLDYNRFSIFTSSLISLIGMLVYAACFGWGVYRLWGGMITYGTMTLFLQMSHTVSNAFSSLIGTVPTAISAATSAGRMMEITSLPAETAAVGTGDGRRFALQLDNVAFAYRGGDTVLQNVSFAVRPGECVAIVGPSGEGKTTLVRLLLDLVAPTSGAVRLLDADSGEEAAVSVRRVCAYVPQGNTLFAGTIADNLRLVKADATDEELEQALSAAGAWSFVQKLPSGMDSPLGEHGGGLSEGQAQRLAIARALLKDAPILLLDEATSALDVKREQEVLESLKASGERRATIVITHRPSVLAQCDRIYRVDATHVTEISREAAAEVVR